MNERRERASGEGLIGGSSGPHVCLSGGVKLRKYIFVFGTRILESSLAEDGVGPKAKEGWVVATVSAQSTLGSFILFFFF